MTKTGMLRSLLLGLVVVATPARLLAQPAPAPVETAKLRDIRLLLDLTGAGKLGMQVMAQMIPQYKQMLPKVPAKFWDDFMKEVNADELVDRVAFIYDRNLTHEEVKAIIAFYQTPAGKKLIAMQPKIAQESMEAGRAWGLELGKKVQQRLREKGFDAQ